MIAVLAASTMSLASAAYAQSAMEVAKARDICNGAPIVSAEYLADGRLKVVCPCNSVTEQSVAAVGGQLLQDNGLCAPGLTSGGAAAAAGAAVLLLVLAGDDDTSTTTTTTGTGN